MKFSNEISDLVYQEYLEIEPKAYHDRIRFFEYNKKPIAKLSYEHRLEISLEYTIALFEVGEYTRFLKNVDQLLAICINDNIFLSIDGVDIYQDLLFKKACSLHNTVDYKGADHVFSELIRINKTNFTYQRAYKRNKVLLLRDRGQRIRAIVISMFMSTGLIIGFELLVVRPLLEDHIELTEYIRNGLFVAAIATMILQESYVRITAMRSIKALTTKS